MNHLDREEVFDEELELSSLPLPLSESLEASDSSASCLQLACKLQSLGFKLKITRSLGVVFSVIIFFSERNKAECQVTNNLGQPCSDSKIQHKR